MAPLSTRISEKDWKRHSDAIIDLYFVRKLPLDSKKGKTSVRQVMQAEHNFHATRAQYETYFKRLDRPKNLTKQEWRAIDAKLSELLEMGFEPRVKISGQVVQNARIERSKRHAFTDEQPSENFSEGRALPLPKHVAIEVRGADSEWTLFTSGEANEDIHPTSPGNDNADIDIEEVFDRELMPENQPLLLTSSDDSTQSLSLETTEHVVASSGSSSFLQLTNDHQTLFFNSHNSPQSDSLWLPWNASYTSSGTSIYDDMRYMADYSSFQFPEFFPDASSAFLNHHSTIRTWGLDVESPFSRLQLAVSIESRDIISFRNHFFENRGAGHENRQELELAGDLLTSPNILIRSLLADAEQITVASRVKDLPHPDILVDNLLSLLPETFAEDGSIQAPELSSMDALFSSPFHKALLFSIANGFAGLRNVPPGAILKWLRKQPEMGSRVFSQLESCPPELAKSLADNLFRAAVEACDEATVILILNATQNSPNAIDPNKIVCKHEGESRLYTPIELAAKYRHMGIVKALLAAKADVNKTYVESNYQDCGALELAIGTRNKSEYKKVDIELVRMLLICRAEVRVSIIRFSIGTGDMELIRILFPHLPPTSHRDFFKADRLNDSSLSHITHFLENSLAFQITKQLFQYCRDGNCSCLVFYQEQIEHALWGATRRGNFDLAKFLLPHTTRKGYALSAAVKSGNSELIEYMFEIGASIDCPVHRSVYRDERHGGYYPLSSPLSEAILSQDNDLIQKFLDMGALNHLNQPEHLEAAVFAAVKIGDYHLMEMILGRLPRRIPMESRRSLQPALILATQNNDTKAALYLLDNSGDLSGQFLPCHPFCALACAMKMQNEVIADRILEAAWAGIYGSIYQAAVWGKVRYVKDLILLRPNSIDNIEHMGGHGQGTALSAAVIARNRSLVEPLLNHGASPNGIVGVDALSPLEAAMTNVDDDIIRLLASSGADPANYEAFRLSIKNSRKGFSTLLKAFSLRYPYGKPGFGGRVLVIALMEGDSTLLDDMLAAKFDVNEYCEQSALGWAITNRNGKGLDLVRKLIQAGGNANSIACQTSDQLRKTALMMAIETRSKEMVQLLLSEGADIHRAARKGLRRTALQYACEIGSFKMVKLLLEKGADVNELPAVEDGGTALQLAARSGSIKIAEFLLSRNALIHAPISKVNGLSALEGAAENGCLDMIRVLWNAAAATGQAFTRAQMEEAANFAEKGGHRGCAEYARSLPSVYTSVSFSPE